DAANTATVPIGIFHRRSAGRGGVADGSGSSMTTPREPASTTQVAQKADLVGATRELAAERGLAERGLRVRRGDQLRRAGLDAVGGGAQQRRALRPVRERVEGGMGSADRRVHGGGVGLDADLRADFAGTGITAQDGFHARLLGSLLTTPSYNPA